MSRSESGVWKYAPLAVAAEAEEGTAGEMMDWWWNITFEVIRHDGRVSCAVLSLSVIAVPEDMELQHQPLERIVISGDPADGSDRFGRRWRDAPCPGPEWQYQVSGTSNEVTLVFHRPASGETARLQFQLSDRGTTSWQHSGAGSWSVSEREQARSQEV